MAKDDTMIVGTAGEHYVAFRLAQLGYIVALPRAATPIVDILVSNKEGTKTISLQVKTAEWALRERGRGENRKAYKVDFILGRKAASINKPNIFILFVDLKGRSADSIPDVYIVPSEDVYNKCKDLIDKYNYIRWQQTIGDVEKYKNNWSIITNVLKTRSS